MHLQVYVQVFGIICMACASPALVGGTHWFLFVVVTSFIATVLWSFVYLLGIREVLNLPINWILTELINTGFATLLYLIAFIVQLATWSNLYGYFRSANIAAGVFGLFNFLAYTAGTYFLFVEHRSSGV
ncbi:CKLF-like MARVEL transmembrane domain-containing protein 4 [Aedes albopictus]|uniref:MARVEL domain-containing protein n=1 Tax=Aedes albopictus TaxID=7160 RepID=A0ABM1ZDH1_AEDAL